MASVRPEYGPTLAELSGSRWPLIRNVALGVAVLLVAFAVIRGEDGKGKHTLVQRKAPAFNIAYLDGIRPVDPQSGELLRLQSTKVTPERPLMTYAVRPFTMPTYAGDASAGFLKATAPMIREMSREIPGFIYRGEGRARINDLPGYQILFTFKRDGRTVNGKRVLLVPDEPGARDGAMITMTAGYSNAVPNVDAVGNNGLLKTPLRSFRFGTERP